MDVQEIEILIDKKGEVHIQVRGIKGKACLDLTKPLEEALGGVILEREFTPEADEDNGISPITRVNQKGK